MTRNVKIVSMVMILFCSSSFVFATTYYVSKSGNDTNSGTSWDTAWATISKVNNSMSGGDTVYFGTGTWRGTLVPVSGTSDDRTTYACSSFVQGIAHIWGSDSVTGWIQHSGNVYKAIWTPTENLSGILTAGAYICGQIDGTFDTVLIPSTSIPTSAGHFYYNTSTDTIYVWCVGGGDPTGKDIEPSCNPAIYVEAGKNHYCTFWGFDIRYGKKGVVLFDDNSTYDYFDHCSITRVGYIDQENASAVFSGRHVTNGQYNRVRACTLGVAVDPDMDNWRFGLCLYTENNFAVESCYVVPGAVYGIYFKESTTGCVMRFNTVKNPTWAGYVTHNDCHYDSIYGNIMIGDDSVPENGIKIYSPGNSNEQFVCNNTIYKTKHTGLHSGGEGTLVAPNYYRYNIVDSIAYVTDMGNEGGYVHLLRGDSLRWTADSNMYYPAAAGFGINWSSRTLSYWQNTLGMEVHTSFTDPGFANPDAGDFSRPSSSQEMDLTYGGRTWTRYGAWQPNNGSDVGEKPQIETPTSFILSQNYPNPFNPTTQIDYQIPEDGYVTLEIFNVLGQKVKTLVKQNQTAEKHIIIWEGRDDQNQELPSGIYFYRLNTKQNVEFKKMVFLK